MCRGIWNVVLGLSVILSSACSEPPCLDSEVLVGKVCKPKPR